MRQNMIQLEYIYCTSLEHQIVLPVQSCVLSKYKSRTQDVVSTVLHIKGQLMRIKLLLTFYNLYLVGTILKYLNVQKKVQDLVQICKGQLASVLVPTAIIMEWRKENRCFLSIHKAFNFSMYSDLSLFLLFLCIYQSFLSTYKDIIGKLSIHHIMFFAYGSSKRKWKPFLLLLSLHQQKKEHRRRRKKKKSFFFFTAVLI